MFERVAAELGPVGVLVTATSAYRSERFGVITDESWSSVVDDLLGATFRTCRAAVPGMQSAGWGRIVNVAARSGLVGVARATHYAAAKAGIIALTASLAKELGPSGILVNAVAPTEILTVKDGVPSVPDERAADMAKAIPLRRLATPEDLAALVVWLGSGANSYVTGETVSLTAATSADCGRGPTERVRRALDDFDRPRAADDVDGEAVACGRPAARLDRRLAALLAEDAARRARPGRCRPGS